MARVLVVGGAGYVGSTTAAFLMDAGHEVWVLDDLSTGHEELILSPYFVRARAGDSARVQELLSQHKFDCVMHFAARSLVAESVKKPKEYYENNVVQTRILLETLLKAGVRKFIFSSTCAIFGDPTGVAQTGITESFPKKPLSPYGETKLQVEEMLQQFAEEKGLQSVALRYFNAAGAERQLRVGEWHEPESHLIPRILKAASLNQSVEIYGTDYPTADGTCVRDYIHVWDLARAHEAAMKRLLERPTSSAGVFEAYNLGTENGSSVREVIETCEEVIGKKISVVERDRRPGDPPRLVACSDQAKKILGFGKNLLSLKEILSSAWEWEKKRAALLRKAIFLDRDGTLNEDPGYLNHPDQLKLLPQVGEALSALKKAGYLLVVVSNQSGVRRGLIPEQNIELIHRRMDELLAPWDVKIDHYQLCFHRPDEDCDCRKPKPKLILDAAVELGVDLAQSYMIGDKASDLGAGYAAGCLGSILVMTGEGEKTSATLQKGQASFIAETLYQAANWILTQENEDS